MAFNKSRKPGIGIMIGIGKPKPGADDDLDSPDPVEGKAQSSMKKPGEKTGPGDNDGDETSGVTQIDVGYSDNDLCGSCAHNQNGECEKYEFQVDDTGHCEGGYEPKDDSMDQQQNMGSGASGAPGAGMMSGLGGTQ